jgi:hypothetical protein
MSTFDDASLVFIPSGYKDQKLYSVKPLSGDGDLTFSRASNATRVASNGLIEKVRTNLLLQSNQFDTTWTNVNSTETSGQSGYDGTSNAWRLNDDAVNGSHDVRQVVSASGSICLSVYAKAGTLSWLKLFNGVGIAYFNLSTGVAGTGGGVITSVGNGWYRCSISSNGSSSLVLVGMSNADNTTSYAGDGTGTIFIQAAQLEVGDIATDYIATTTTSVSVGPVSGLPRLDYLNSSCPRLLLEPQRTNLLTFSEQFDNADWNKETGNSVVANSAVSPDGYTNADSISATSSNILNINQELTPPAATATYTFSGFFKKQSTSNVEIYLFQSVGGFKARASINLDAGTITASVGTATITNYGNGWYRASVTGTFTLGLISTCGIYNESTTGTRNVYAYGCQVEQASYATSYIPTLSTSVTRVADDCYLNPQTLLGATQGSWFADIQDFRFEVTGTTTPSVYVGYNASNYLAIVARAAGNDVNIVFAKRESGTATTLYTEVAPSGATKFCFTWNGTSLKLFVNGSKVYDDNSFAGFIAWDDLELNNDARPANYRLNQTLLFPTQISDADAIALTA